MKFRTFFSGANTRITSAVGSPIADTFKLKIGSDGRRSLVIDGKVNLYDKIQSFALETDINYILTRFANGDDSALSKVQGLYGDFTSVPTSVVELQQRVVDAEKLFYQLPVDVREKFEHNPSLFYSMIGSDSFNEILGIDKSFDNPIKDGIDTTIKNIDKNVVSNSVVEGGALDA